MEKILEVIISNPWLIVIVLLWTLPWKAAALWRAARRAQFGWFLTMIVLNSLGILEILYIFIFSKKKKKEEVQSSPVFQDKARPYQNMPTENINKKIIM